MRPWMAWIVTAWGLGVVFCSLRPLLGWYTLRSLRRVGVSPASDEVLAALRRVSERLGVRRAVGALQSTVALVPMVIGYLRPVILLPLGLVTSVPAAQLEAILAHELTHVRRHDFIVNVLQTLVETLFFYHPAVWWLSRQIRVEREHCCDDHVVMLLDNRVEYGRALVAIDELRGRNMVLALGATDGPLLSRVRRIVGVAPDRAQTCCFARWPIACVGLVTLGLVVTIAFAAIENSSNSDDGNDNGGDNQQDPRSGEQRAANELERLQGFWAVDSCESEDAALKVSDWDARRWRWTIKSQEIVWGREGQEWKIIFKIDPTKTPKQIHFAFRNGPHQGAQCLGIYDWDGNEGKNLRILIPDPGATVARPTSFERKVGSQTSQITLRPLPPIDPVKELASFQGTWCWDFSQPWTWPQPIGVGTDSDGRKSEKRWVIDGNRITWVGRDGQRIYVTFTIDPFKAPKQIEFTFLNGPYSGKKSIGIYESRGDEDYRELCMTDPGTDAPRPTDFSAGSFLKQSIIAIHKVSSPAKPTASNELKRLQGAWQIELCDSTHKSFGGTQQEVLKWQWTIRDDEILWSRQGDVWKLKLNVDPSKSPREMDATYLAGPFEMDLTYLSGPFQGAKCRGIYGWGGVDGRSLLIAIQNPGSDAPPPTRFAMRGDIKTGLMILRPSKPSDAEREIAALQGIWTLRNFDTGNFRENKDPSSWPLPGGKGPDKSGEGSELRWVVKANEITWTSPAGREIKASFTIDPLKRPKQIDLTFLSGPNKGETCPGLYQRGDLDANILWLCMADPGSKTERPKDFSYEWGKGRSLMSFYPFEPSVPQAPADADEKPDEPQSDPDKPASNKTEASPTAPAVKPAAAQDPTLHDLIQQMAVYEQMYLPFDIKAMETFRFPDDLTPQERARNLLTDGRKHQRLMEYAQLERRIWRRTETDLVDDEVEQGPYEQFSDGERIIQRSPSSLSINGNRALEYYINDRKNDIFNYLHATPLCGVFCLSSFGNGELFSEAFKADEEAVELAWDNGDAKLTFGYGKPHWNTRFVLWLSRAHAWHPVRLQRFWDAKDTLFHDEWEVTKFVRIGKDWRVAEGTHRYRNRDHKNNVQDARFEYSMDFKILAEKYGRDVDEKQFQIQIPAGAKVRDNHEPKAEPPPPKTREITVTVVDVAGNPIPKASVRLSASQVRDWDVVATDEQGVARSAKAPADKVTVQITAAGFRPVTWIMGDVNELRAIMVPLSPGVVVEEGKPVADAWITNESLQIRADGFTYVPNRDWDGRDDDWSNSEGRFELKSNLTLRRHDAVIPIIAVHPDRDKMAIRFVPASDLGRQQELALENVCHIHGHCQFEGMTESVEVGIGLESSAGQYIGFLSTRRELTPEGLRVDFQVRVPPGDYVLKSGRSSRHSGFSIPVTVRAGENELDLGTTTVPATGAVALRGKPAPELELIWRAGQETTWEKLRGKVVVLDFWGTWCGPCVDDMPLLMDVADQFRGKPVEWLSVHTPNLKTFDELDREITTCQEKSWNKRTLPFTTVLDRSATDGEYSGQTSRRYGVAEWPTLIVVDQQGQVVGPISKKKLADTISRLLGDGTGVRTLPGAPKNAVHASAIRRAVGEGDQVAVAAPQAPVAQPGQLTTEWASLKLWAVGETDDAPPVCGARLPWCHARYILKTLCLNS
ncbi:MAG TPA: TIGR03067 domain-containing protein [Pirellulales bacterium]|nr:TIGR03067 domain-containing protein [Pirellulales bacterium]